jgi:CheY-like chemotaxis protein
MRILIADDHEVIRSGVIRLLQSRDDVEEYAEATNGKGAIEKALEWKPDLILLDVRLPLLDGFSVAREIKQHEPDIAKSGYRTSAAYRYSICPITAFTARTPSALRYNQDGMVI